MIVKMGWFYASLLFSFLAVYVAFISYSILGGAWALSMNVATEEVYNTTAATTMESGVSLVVVGMIGAAASVILVMLSVSAMRASMEE